MNWVQRIYLICFGIILMGAALFMSCRPDKTVDVAPVSPQIHDIGTGIDAQSKALDQTTKTIKSNVQDGMSKTPESARPILWPRWSNILVETGVQEQIVKNLDAEKTRADEAEANSVKFEKQYDDEKAARIKAEDNTTKELRQKYLAYSGILFFGALICGGLAIWSTNKLFMYGGLLCGTGCLVCIFLVQIVQLIPWIVLGIMGVVLTLIIYKFWHAQQTQTAVTQLTQTIEAIKPKMTLEGRKEMFGEGPGPGDVEHIQTQFTKKLVKCVRDNLRVQDLAPGVPVPLAVDCNIELTNDRVAFLRNPHETSTFESVDIATSTIKKKCGSRKITGPIKAKMILH